MTCAKKTDLIHPQLMTLLEASAYIILILSFSVRSLYVYNHTHTHYVRTHADTYTPNTTHAKKHTIKEGHTQRTQPQNKKFNLPDDIRSTSRPQISQQINSICFPPTFTLPCLIVLALSSFLSVSLTARSA